MFGGGSGGRCLPAAAAAAAAVDVAAARHGPLSANPEGRGGKTIGSVELHVVASVASRRAAFVLLRAVVFKLERRI